MNIEAFKHAIQGGFVALTKLALAAGRAISAFSPLPLADQLHPLVANDLPGPGPRKSRFTGVAAMRREARRERNRRAGK